MLDEIELAGGRADLAAAAAALSAIERERRPLDIAAMRNRDQHVFLDDQVFDRKFALGLDYLCAALIGEFLLEIFDLGRDKLHLLALVAKDGLEAGDGVGGFLVFGLDFFALERGQAAQRQIE